MKEQGILMYNVFAITLLTWFLFYMVDIFVDYGNEGKEELVNCVVPDPSTFNYNEDGALRDDLRPVSCHR